MTCCRLSNARLSCADMHPPRVSLASRSTRRPEACPAKAGAGLAKKDLVLCGERDHLRRRLLLHVVDGPEQVVELTRRRHPEEALHGLVGLVEDTVGKTHGQPDEVARSCHIFMPVQQQVETPLEHVN